MNSLRPLTYEQYMVLVRARRPAVVKDDFVVAECRGNAVLDVGCIDHSIRRIEELGDRWLHGRIAEVASEVVGVDILAEEAAELRGRGYEIVVADAQHLRLDRRFDRVVLGDILEHVENPGELLSTALCHVSPGGRILLSTPNPFYIGRLLTALAKNYVGVNPQHVAWFDPKVVFRLGQRVGLAVVDFHWATTRYEEFRDLAGLKGRASRLLVRAVESRRPVCRSDYVVVLIPAEAGPLS
ncbi:MAG: class I SAM-dependent methyltransferase [Chloroflexi bacterium]|nr:class I SAM-dependent methyltransferase [Chloroflexota bacterium]